MHVRKRALRLLSAVALVTFALPLAVNGASPVNAQTSGSQPSASIPDVASVSPAVAINPIGQEHTVVFTCGAQSFASATSTTGTSTAFVAPGCYNVSASVTDITSGAATTFDSALCGGVAASGGSGTVNCSSTRSPICPVGTVAATGTALTATTPCVTSSTSIAGTPDVSNNVVVTINPGAPHAYIIDFTGYTPTTAAGSCPAGTTLQTGITLSVTTGTSTAATLVGPVNACRFVVEAQKKYAEVTSIVLTPVNTCGGTLTFAEGLKSFFGPPCVVNVVVTGTVILKTGITCGNGTEPVTGTAAPSEFGPGATYQCANGTLSVVGVSGPAAGQTSLAGVRLAPGAGTGVGSFTTSGTLGSLCAGTTNTSSTTVFVTTISGINTTTGTASLCPTGPGAASLQLCLVGPDGTANTLPNNQPPLCSNTITANFTQRTERVVPQIRWSGEKIALTKCFGIGLANSPVEFVLKSTGAPLNATLIPASLGSTGSAPTSPASSTTIWTTSDNNGCATVLGLADGEGTMQVDAAIFNNSAAGAQAGTPLVNEHAFEVFYLKFDHVNLENIKFQTYTVAQALQPYLGFLSKTPALNGASAANASFQLPSPPGTGNIAGTGTFGIPLCAPDFVRAMVHGYFEMPGDPSGRPAAQVAVGGASSQTGSAGSYVLPAGRWVLPEDWPLLATFAGFNGSSPLDITPSSVFAWDLNSGWVYNPTGETPVVCGVAAGVAGTNGLLLGGLSTPTAQTFGNIPVPANANVGPCFGQDQTMVGGTTFYATAAGSLSSTQLATYATNTGLGCLDDFTAGFGPFDPTRACTSPFPLTFSPAGSSLIGVGTADCGTGISACLIPTQEDSTYLPNGTLNQWDAPMPPAQISFGITSGPGFLGQVSKTNLYQIRFDAGAAPCPSGYTLYAGTNTCQLELDPNPFYAEAIPASPFIPNVDNNHGYLWNSFNFSAGTTTVVSSTPAFTGVGTGGFVAGQSTQVSFRTAVNTPCPALSVTVTASTLTTGATCTVSGGVNLLPAGAGTATPQSIVVADGRGFLPGTTIEVYSNTTGAPLGTVTVSAVLPSPRTVNGISYPNAVELQFTGTLLGTNAAGSVTAISTLFGLPVPGAGAFTVGQQITIGNPSGTQATSTVAAIDTTNNIVYVTSAELIASQLGDCLLSRTPVGSGLGLGEGGSGTSFLSCEPGLTIGGTAAQALVTPGTVINSGPVGANDEGALNLYPFWQWLPTPPTSGGTPTTATVYSDNHGEAVVSLNTTVQSQIAPSSTGTCPAGYTPITAGNPPVTTGCILQLGSLGTMNIGNGSLGTVKSALAAFSASSPGCIQTFPSGTFAALSGVTVGANGPAAGQICVNSFGAVEFGANATLGTTSIVAVADYPYIREHPQIASPTLTKVFQSGFAKTLSVSAGTAAPANTTAYTVTVTATDVCGNPITNEPVNVYAISATNAVVLAPLNVGAVLQSSSNSASVQLVPSGANAGTGTFTLEVLNTAIGTQGLVVKAVFPAEGIERLVTVISGTPVGQNTTVVYSPGWQQVGGPSGSNFSTVEALFAYDTGSGQYTNATSVAGNISSAAPTCTGYWGYFAAAMTVTLPVTSKAGDTAACTLAAGYNLVGNPFGSNAKLPSGVTAYHWNGTSYDVVSQIGIGQSVWVFNDGTLNSLTLTAQ